jgi:Ca2+-binding EF-hand superfamily protein
MSCRIASLLILLVANEVLLAQQPYAPPVPAVQVQPPEDKAKQLAPEKVLRMLGADGKTAYDATYVGAFRFLDQNRDNYLTWQEYVINGRYGSETIRGAIFRVTDKDQNWYISLAEYRENRHVTDEAKELLDVADVNRDGYISRAEFLRHPRIKNEKTAGQVFAMLDVNRDGWIYPAEYLYTWQTWVKSLPATWLTDSAATVKQGRKRNR